MALRIRPLHRIDPAEAWAPWRPTPADPWGPKWAAHLYRRAAFGPGRGELARAEHLGPEGTLDVLLRGRPDAAAVRETLADVGRVAAAHDDSGNQLRGWWLYVMLHGGHPLREKLTLFWHNHFATSLAKVQDPELMFRQNELLRDHALGRFGPFLQAVSKDPAMLLWLDSNSNVKAHPNENYARELMELFSLGVGHYTERDVREAARAFTGWHTIGAAFRYSAAEHDGGTKTVLGKTGPWNGDDVVRIVLTQPAAARFLVRKLYQFLVSENDNPADAFLEPLADAFRKSDYDIALLVRTILASRHFYSEHAYRQRLKNPVEYVLGAVRAVCGLGDENTADPRPVPQQALVRWIGAMGQALFAPPNVKGWPGGRAWFNTATMLERDNFAAALTSGALWTNVPASPAAAADLRPGAVKEGARPDGLPGAFDPAHILHEIGTQRPEEVARALLDRYLPGGVAPDTHLRLTAFLAAGRPTGPALAQRVREAVHAVLTLAEYQLA